MNIGEIARRAGVSRSTVSYALSGKRPVSDDTRRRIQQVIDEPGYRPNAGARALANGRTSTIGLVFPPAGNHYTISRQVPRRPVPTSASCPYPEPPGAPPRPRPVASSSRSRCSRTPDATPLRRSRCPA
ncbi:hypothetical protein SY2F82_34240 [Streptomyces sp. Y2F8-2]|nr:hypothetical protein SY2F82_34240 [Streptomyces sp. Y2F8-2]